MRNLEATAGDGVSLNLRTEFWNRLEPILELFERALSRGERPALEAFVPALPPAERRALLAELAHAELEFRLKAAEPARVEDYLTRYHELRSDPGVLLSLIRAEYRVRRQREPALQCAEYEARFPEQGAAWGSVLSEATDPEAGAAADGRPARVAAGLEPVEAGAGPRPALARLGDFRVLDEIGRGGMGIVYRARDEALGRDVAVKLLADRYLAGSAVAQRFAREAQITGQLQHPGIPAVHQVGTLADGRPFLAMKLIKGSTLADILKQRRDPSAGRSPMLAIFEAVCQAVGYAHAHRVIHRDLKPANVMVGAFGEVQVMDWGLAKVLGEESPGAAEALAADQTRAGTQISPTPEAGSETQAGSLVGTPSFIAPEQAVGEIERVNERSDVFGLGALLAVILTGKPPYVGETFEAVRVQAVRGKLDDCFARLDASGAESELVALCKRCLAFEPADRPADAGAVAAVVAGLRAAADERARRAEGEAREALVREGEQRKRRRTVQVAGAVIALALLAGLTVSLWQMFRAIQAREDETKARQQAFAALRSMTSDVVERKFAQGTVLTDDDRAFLRGVIAQYDAFAAIKSDDAESRAVRAEGRFRVAKMRNVLGELQEAEKDFDQAVSIRQQLAAELPSRFEFRQELAQSHLHRGALLHATGRLKEAEQDFDQALSILRQPAADFPSRPEFRQDLAQSHLSRGVLLRTTGRLEDAEKEFDKALGIRKQLAADFPSRAEFRQDMAVSHNNRGVVLEETGRAKEAEQEYDQALSIRKQLAAEFPSRPEFRQELAQSHSNRGALLTTTGRLKEAEQDWNQAVTINKQLVADFPSRPEFRQDLVHSLNNRGCRLRRLRMTGRLQEAENDFEQALTICKQLAADFPTVPNYQTYIASLHNNLGWLLAREKRFAEAFAALDAGLAIREKLAESHPKNSEYTTDLGWNHIYRGAALFRSGPVDGGSKAAADLRRAIELWAKVPALDSETQFERSRALALLAGLGAAAKSGVTKAEAALFADQSVAALRDAFGAGFNQLDELKEPDFDSLRGRDDFQKVVVEQEAKSGQKPKPKD
jgi:tetratricopeptide (TPR) repeat protein/tRNA A-37 threonylcarbamoyl transferase component Bud32